MKAAMKMKKTAALMLGLALAAGAAALPAGRAGAANCEKKTYTNVHGVEVAYDEIILEGKGDRYDFPDPLQNAFTVKSTGEGTARLTVTYRKPSGASAVSTQGLYGLTRYASVLGVFSPYRDLDLSTAPETVEEAYEIAFDSQGLPTTIQPAAEEDGAAISLDSESLLRINGPVQSAAVTLVSAPVSEETAVYRLYNRSSGEHFFTASRLERDVLLRAGWRDEGRAFIGAAVNASPVFRLYNRRSGQHLFTKSAAERDVLTGHGFQSEGIAFYSGGSTPVYRLYNARSGQHLFTTSAVERDVVKKAGWKDEGIGWYSEK